MLMVRVTLSNAGFDFFVFSSALVGINVLIFSQTCSVSVPNVIMLSLLHNIKRCCNILTIPQCDSTITPPWYSYISFWSLLVPVCHVHYFLVNK